MLKIKNPKKKVLGFLGALLMIVLLLPLFAAFEAHVINVKAHIENALQVSPAEINFGIVFPEEGLDATFTVALSDSFMDTTQTRVSDVEYRIVQKLKPIPDSSPTAYYKDLRPFLTKTKVETDTVMDTEATATLDKSTGDIVDIWNVHLDVPLIAGSTPLPPDAPVVPEDPPGSGTAGDYGADIWIEVTGLSYDQLIDVDYGATFVGPGPLSATEVQHGDSLSEFPGTPSNTYLELRMLDGDNSGSWTKDYDFLMWDVSATADGEYHPDDVEVRGDGPWGPLIGTPFPINLYTPGVANSLNIRYYDQNNDNHWNPGEDIVSDTNGNGIYD